MSWEDKRFSKSPTPRNVLNECLARCGSEPSQLMVDKCVRLFVKVTIRSEVLRRIDIEVTKSTCLCRGVLSDRETVLGDSASVIS